MKRIGPLARRPTHNQFKNEYQRCFQASKIKLPKMVQLNTVRIRRHPNVSKLGSFRNDE
jgi:hypothetical protein